MVTRIDESMKLRGSYSWRDNWICFSPAMDSEDTDAIVMYLMKENIKQNWYTIYGSFRSMLSSMNLDIGYPHIFHGTTYVGCTLEDIETYVYTQKRMHGEL
jgi:hypothetical protein